MATLLLWTTTLAAAPSDELESLAPGGGLGAPHRETRELLEWLGVLAVVEQAPAALDYALAAERRQRQVDARQETRWRRALAGTFNARRLQRRVLDHVVAHHDPAVFRHAYALLQQPIARRARYFERAMEQRGAAANLQEFLGQLGSLPPTPERRARIADIGAVTQYALMMALVQSHATRAVQLRASAMDDPMPAEQPVPPLSAEVAARQAYLQPLLVDYLLYAWRYLKTDELAAYNELLRKPQVQHVSSLAQTALRDVLSVAVAEAMPVTGSTTTDSSAAGS